MAARNDLADKKACTKASNCLLREGAFQHFLFNALNSAVCLCHRDPSRVADLLVQIGDYLRAAVEEERDLVPLRVELERIRLYLAVQEARFGDRLEVALEIDPEARGVVPPFALVRVIDAEVCQGVLRGARGGRLRLSLTGGDRHSRVLIETEGARTEEAGRCREERLRLDRALRSLGGQGLEVRSDSPTGTRISFDVPASEGSIRPDSAATAHDP
jgi:LytS/YehU family sensor histidine kinase